jgi:voltage-gated potassium channel
MQASTFIVKALYNSYRKIMLFMLFLVLVVIIIGSMMYIIETGTPGFESIPNSIYWAVVTITTVGYGDVSPVTPLGKFISIMVMLCGYSIIAVPTGILTSEMAKSLRVGNSKIKCDRCGATGHDNNARYCRMCAEPLNK